MSKYIKLEDALKICQPLSNYSTAIKEVLELLPTIEVSEDCISRSALRKEMEMYGAEITLIDTAPSVVPKARPIVMHLDVTDDVVDRAVEKIRAEGEDCISRAWVLNRLAKHQKDYTSNELDDWQNTVVDWITTDIEDAPSVVPTVRKNRTTTEQSSLVRCKDCRWSKPNNEGDYDCKCHIPTFRVPEDGYCNFGERIEE